MIAYLKGRIIDKSERRAVIDVNGVGYCVNIAKSLCESLKEGSETPLFIHTHVREDDISLYGFQTQDELDFFDLLLSVSGVGPKSALEILNAPASKVKQAIVQRNIAHLTAIRGIGRKTAERIIVDLHGKIKEEVLLEENAEQAGNEDIVQALIALGYHRQQVAQGLKNMPPDIAGEEAVIKYFLQNN